MKHAENVKGRTKKSCHEQIIREESRTDSGYEYTYRLTSRESPFVASYKLALYSVSVMLRYPDGKVTERCTGDLFHDVGKAIVFFNKLVKNLATPIDLVYVLEDELSK